MLSCTVAACWRAAVMPPSDALPKLLEEQFTHSLFGGLRMVGGWPARLPFH